MKAPFLCLATAFVFWNCGTKSPNIDSQTAHVQAASRSVNSQEVVTVLTSEDLIKTLFLELPDDIWQGLPEHLLYLKQRSAREKIWSCGKCQEGDILLEENKSRLRIFDMPLAKNVKKSYEHDDVEFQNNTELLLQIFSKDKDNFVVFIGLGRVQHASFEDIYNLTETENHIQKSKLYNAETKQWSDFPLIKNSNKTATELMDGKNCRWVSDNFNQETLESVPLRLACECEGMELSRTVLVWDGNIFEKKTEKILRDEYNRD